MRKPKNEKKSNGDDFEGHKMWRNDISYSITISPNPEKQHFGFSPKARYAAVHVGTVKALDTLSEYSTYKLYPEIGKKNMFIHYHGTIVFKDAVGAMLHGIPALTNKKFLVGRTKQDYIVDIDTIEDSKIWDKYCHKDEEMMKPFVESVKGRKYGISSNEVYIGDGSTSNKILFK